MNITARRSVRELYKNSNRLLSTSGVCQKKHQCRLLIVGGGTGGCTMASKFSRLLPKGSVIVLEPSEDHYYQPMYTLVGAGVKKLSDCRKPAGSVLPPQATWLRDSAKVFSPDRSVVETCKGDEIEYEYLIVAVGLQFRLDKLKGLEDALKRPDSRVSTIYMPQYVEKTWSDLRSVREGELLFTYPQGPVKCPGAPQKIMYLADSYHRKANTRNRVNITYNSALGVIFGVKKYADALWRVVDKKDLAVNLQTSLVEVDSDNKEAVFQCGGDKGELTRVRYSLLHAVPPMSPPSCLSAAPRFTDACGMLDVDKFTLRHRAYPNVFGLGDCTNTPNSKTAAAVASQSYVVEQQLRRAMGAGGADARYDGYGSCPLVTSYNSCILAEFDYDLNPKETLPFDQSEERYLFYLMKVHLFPFLYWNLMLKGKWHGPNTVRKIINPLKK